MEDKNNSKESTQTTNKSNSISFSGFTFGIAIPDNIEDLENSLIAIQDNGFHNIIAPYALINSKKSKTIESYKKIIDSMIIDSIVNITSPNISREIATQQKGIIEKFILNLKDDLKSLYLFDIKKCSIDIAPENDFTKSEKRIQKIAILKKISPMLIEHNITLLIPVRFPLEGDNIDMEEYISFIRDTMSPNIKIALNIHPHEIRNSEDIPKLISSLRFFIESISFIYEPETGNYLVKQLITPWLNQFKKIHYSKTIFISPRTTSNSIFKNEVEKIKKLELEACRALPSTLSKISVP